MSKVSQPSVRPGEKSSPRHVSDANKGPSPNCKSGQADVGVSEYKKLHDLAVGCGMAQPLVDWAVLAGGCLPVIIVRKVGRFDTFFLFRHVNSCIHRFVFLPTWEQD